MLENFGLTAHWLQELAPVITAQFRDVPMWNWALQAVALVASAVGAEMNARLNIRGFYVWLFSNVVLAVLHAATGLWVLVLLDVYYFQVNVRGILHWSRQQPEQAPQWLLNLVNRRPSSAAVKARPQS